MSNYLDDDAPTRDLHDYRPGFMGLVCEQCFKTREAGQHIERSAPPCPVCGQYTISREGGQCWNPHCGAPQRPRYS